MVGNAAEDAEVAAGWLLERFGSLSGVLEAPPSALRHILGESDLLQRLCTFQAARFEALNDDLSTAPFDPADRCVAAALIEMMSVLEHEELRVILLGPASRYNGFEVIERGTRRSLSTCFRLLFASALKRDSRRLVLVHNHPSGNPEPSRTDIVFTKKAIEIGRSLDIEIADHLIVGGQRIYSMASGRVL